MIINLPCCFFSRATIAFDFFLPHIGTLITQFENSFTKVDWSASVNGSYKDVISGYLHHETDGGLFRLVLTKKVDLEFISTDLVCK